jgi:hypothetical protein
MFTISWVASQSRTKFEQQGVLLTRLHLDMGNMAEAAPKSAGGHGRYVVPPKAPRTLGLFSSAVAEPVLVISRSFFGGREQTTCEETYIS